MNDDYRHLTGRRRDVAVAREIVDAVTGALNYIPVVGTAIDDLGDAATNLGMFVYSLAYSPYLPGRDFSPGMLALETVAYGLTAALELIPGINDIMPGYALTSQLLDALYGRRLRGRQESLYRRRARLRGEAQA